MSSIESTAIINSEDTQFIDDGKPLKPLADPVIAYIFRSVESDGEAMRGLATSSFMAYGNMPFSRPK